jgi:hypothetical protein
MDDAAELPWSRVEPYAAGGVNGDAGKVAGDIRVPLEPGLVGDAGAAATTRY